MVEGVKQKLIEKLEKTPFLKQNAGIYNLTTESIMAYTPEKALAVLNYLNNFQNKVDNSITERQQKLDEEKAQAEVEVEKARKAKAEADAQVPVDKLDDNYPKLKEYADKMWDKLIYALQKLADATKHANNNAIFNIVFGK